MYRVNIRSESNDVIENGNILLTIFAQTCKETGQNLNENLKKGYLRK